MARKVRVVCGSANGKKVNIAKRAVMARENRVVTALLLWCRRS